MNKGRKKGNKDSIVSDSHVSEQLVVGQSTVWIVLLCGNDAVGTRK